MKLFSIEEINAILDRNILKQDPYFPSFNPYNVAIENKNFAALSIVLVVILLNKASSKQAILPMSNALYDADRI